MLKILIWALPNFYHTRYQEGALNVEALLRTVVAVEKQLLLHILSVYV